MTTTEERGLMSSDLPFELRMCPHLRRERQGPAVRRVRTPAGDDAWLVTGYAEIRELLNDGRIGRSHPAPDDRAQYAGNPTYDQVMGSDHGAADAMHAGLRGVLKPHFTTRRMLELRPALAELVRERVDALLEHGAPADLREDFSGPLVRLVFAEMLGVPAADRDRCAELMRLGATGELGGLYVFLTELAADPPPDSMVARLCAGGLTGDQVVQIAMLLQFAGFGATVKQIEYGFLLLTQDPPRRELLAANPELLPVAVEEMLRLSGSLSLPRYAREDVTVGGVRIGAGDLVLLDLTQGNYDADAFPDPTGFAPERSPNRHLTFGHGVWTCLGAPLARQVLHLVLGALLTRVPTLRPTTPIGNTSGPLSGGLPETLEVAW
jgi:cytochrome P450 monooxygenase